MLTRRMLFQFPLQTRISTDQIASSLVVVSEELRPASDGTLNLTFLPGNSFIQLFVNGLQTRPGRDFTIIGQKITLLAPFYSNLITDPKTTFDVYYYR